MKKYVYVYSICQKNKCTHTKVLINITKQGLLQGKKTPMGLNRVFQIFCIRNI